jgi:hypothetical protein
MLVASFLLASLGLAGWMFIELPKAKEAQLDRECEQLLKESQWGMVAPPMERNDVWMEHKESCIARQASRESGSQSDDAHRDTQ